MDFMPIYSNATEILDNQLMNFQIILLNKVWTVSCEIYIY